MQEIHITRETAGGRLDKMIFRYLDKAGSGFVDFHTDRNQANQEREPQILRRYDQHGCRFAKIMV